MMTPADNAPNSGETRTSWRRRLPILVILAAGVIGGALFHDDLSFSALARHRDALLAFRDGHYMMTVLGFVAGYVLIVTLSLPGGTIATLTGGFLFGTFPGVLYNVLAAGLGAVAVFLAARAGFGDSISRRIEAGGGAVAKLQAGLRENEWSVLFLMRLVPVVPFFLANLLPAFVGTRLLPFAITTFLGIIPGALVFTSVGSGLGKVFAQGEMPDLGIIFTPPVLMPILGLAVLASLPMVLKAFKRTR